MLKNRQRVRDHTAEAALFYRRATISFITVFLLLCLLVANLTYIQVFSFKTYQTRSDQNRISILPLPPTRGLIYDRNGILLAENKPVFDLQLIYEKVPDMPETLDKLIILLGLSNSEIDDFRKKIKAQRRFKSVTLKSNLSQEQIAIFSVNRHKFPGVSINSNLKRYYPYGKVLTHVLGYVAKINTKDVKRLEDKGSTANYKGTRDIGKLGVESYYEGLLHGEAGYQEVEVNNRGRIIRTLKVVPPKPGRDLTLNIDLPLQQAAYAQLAGRRGSVVILDAKNSGVLAMVSTPSYDPNLFVHGINTTAYSKLLDPIQKPLINRATQGRYPPASTIKPLMAIAGLEDKVISSHTKIFDPGWYEVPNTTKKFRDWKRWGHGWVDVYKAIEQSCDTYFYYLAFDLGIDKIHDFMIQFGFGQYTGIDLHEETKAIMPSREWKRLYRRQSWYHGDTIPIGIGQGYWLTTPLQLAQSINILANRGKINEPRILKGFNSNTGSLSLPLDQKAPIKLKNERNWQVAIDGMYGVANNPHGTALKAFRNTSYVVAGKSGTAQVFGLKKDEKYDASTLAEHLKDNAMFVAFAPLNNPQVVAAVVLENAGGGSSHAAPVVRKIFDTWFENNPPLLEMK